jgi:hypothetical protein
MYSRQLHRSFAAKSAAQDDKILEFFDCASPKDEGKNAVLSNAEDQFQALSFRTNLFSAKASK